MKKTIFIYLSPIFVGILLLFYIKIPNLFTAMFNSSSLYSQFEFTDSYFKNKYQDFMNYRLGVFKTDFSSQSKPIFIQSPHSFTDEGVLELAKMASLTTQAQLLYTNNDHKKFNDLNTNSNHKTNILIPATSQYIKHAKEAKVVQFHTQHQANKHDLVIISNMSLKKKEKLQKCFKSFLTVDYESLNQPVTIIPSIISKSCLDHCEYTEFHFSKEALAKTISQHSEKSNKCFLLLL